MGTSIGTAARPPRGRTGTGLVSLGLGLVLVCAVAIFGLAVPAGQGGADVVPRNAGGGVLLDGWGGLHVFGGSTLDTRGAGYWPGWDIARAAVVRGDGSGGWQLDGFGGLHAFGAAPAISTPWYWPGWDIARSFVVTSTDASGQPDGSQGYLLDGLGGLHPWGGAPSLSGAPYWPGQDVARGLQIHRGSDGRPDGGWILDAHGRIHAFGAAPAPVASDLGVASASPPASPPTSPAASPAAGGPAASTVWRQLHVATDGQSGFAVSRWGVVSVLGAATVPTWDGYADFGAWGIVRDVTPIAGSGGLSVAGQPQPVSAAAMAAFQSAARGVHGGVTLDGFGGLHPFGGLALDTVGAGYWRGWDIARAVAVRADGSGGWQLDGLGGIHAFGAAPSVTAVHAAWPRWDIARAIVVTSYGPDGLADGRQGYLLDGFGGLHPWGGAASLSGVSPPAPWWPGQDRARGLEIHYGPGGRPDGGWVMESDGTVHAFGGAASSVGGAGLSVCGADSSTIGGPVLGKPLWRQVHASNGGLELVGRWGLTRAVGDAGSPYWDGYRDFGSWDITRDLVLVDPSRPGVPEAQPVSPAAGAAFGAAAFDLVPYRGWSTWEDVFAWSRSYTGGHPTFGLADIDRMAAAGVQTLLIQAARWDAPGNADLVDPDVLLPLIQRAHARGVRVVPWYLPTLVDTGLDLRRLLAIANLGDGLAVDIEARDVGDVGIRNERLVALSAAVRRALPGRTIGGIVLPPVVMEVVNPNYWPGFPWRDIASYYDVWQPMSYWTDRLTGSGYRDAYRYTAEDVVRLRNDLGQLGAVVDTIGGIAGGSTAADVDGMVRAVADTGSIGGGLYDWATTDPSLLPHLAPLRR